MDSRAVKVFIACFLGAGIGALVSLELIKPHYPYLWWIGALIGGLVGYLSYEFKEVCQAVRTAWRQVIGWKPNREWWRNYFLGIFCAVNIAITFITVIFVFIAIYDLFKIGIGVFCFDLTFSDFRKPVEEFFLSYVVISLFIGFFMGFFSIACYPFGNEIAKDIKESRFGLKIFNPIILPLFIFWKAPSVLKRVLQLALQWVPVGLALIANFIKTVFILIHSDERLLCGVDAAIGATVGYFCGSALYGAMFGGIFGVINFELVSRWWLGLCKVKAQN